MLDGRMVPMPPVELTVLILPESEPMKPPEVALGNGDKMPAPPVE